MPLELRENSRSCVGHEFTLGRGRKARGDGTSKDKMTRCLHFLPILPALLKSFPQTLSHVGWGRWMVHGREAVYLAHGCQTSQEETNVPSTVLPSSQTLYSAKSSFLPYIHQNCCGS